MLLIIILFHQFIILKLNETLDKMYVIQILQCNLQSRPAIPFDVPRRLSFLIFISLQREISTPFDAS